MKMLSSFLLMAYFTVSSLYADDLNSEDMIKSVKDQVSKMSWEEETKGRIFDSSTFDCEQRTAYIDKKIQSSMTVKDLVKKMADEKPKIVIFGNNHALWDQKVWFDEIEEAYRKANAGLDCVFEESDASPIEQALYAEGPAYFKKLKNMGKAVEAFARDRKIPFRALTEFQDAGSEDLSIRLGGDDDLNAQKHVHTDLLREDFTNKIRRIGIDNQSDLATRDLFMAQYVKSLFDSGYCHFAVVNLGKGHLSPQKYLLEQRKISTFTVGFENLNAYTRDFQHPMIENGKVQKTKGASFLDYPGCPYRKENRPKESLVISTADAQSPLITENDLLSLRWSYADAHIIAPVVPTDPGDDWVKKSPRLFKAKKKKRKN